MSLTVVVMTFNEAATLRQTVDELAEVAARSGAPYEILVVDDGSNDGSGRIADEIALDLGSVRVVHHADNQGLGGVYRTGFSEARMENVTFFPADGQFPASIIEDFLPHLAVHDMVLGYLPRRSGLISRLLSWVERVLYGVLFGGFPRFQGILMFRRDLLDRFPLVSTGRGWAVLMELILRAHRAHCSMLSLPTSIRPRSEGVSKVNNVRTILSNLRQLLVLRRQLDGRVTDVRR